MEHFIVNVNNKTIWITGASSGIGKALCEELAKKGARLILTSRREPELEKIRQTLNQPDNHTCIPLDISDYNTLTEKALEALSTIGKVDILINNAGISQRSLILETDLKVYEQLMAVNYLGVIALTKAVLPQMVERKSGCIVTVSSVAGKIGTKERSGYSGSKYAVIGFMDCLRSEVTEHNIQCLTVCPGFVNTNIAINALTGDGTNRNRADNDNASGISANSCAIQIIKGIEKNKQEIVTGKGQSKIAPLIKRISPQLINYITAKRSRS